MSQVIHISKSHRLFEKAKQVIPGGVNSPVRSCQAVGAEPIFIDHADGAYMFDVDGQRYLDYIGSWGALILGHKHPRLLEAIEDAIRRGTSFGAPCPYEVDLAELLCRLMRSIEMVRMVNSGTEATMSAIRLARAFTNRSTIIKFDGCYHGHGDSFLVKAGSGLATLDISSSLGVPKALSELTISLPFNSLSNLKQCFKSNKDIAAVIIEPIVGNCGLVLPQPGFLEELRELCTIHGALLIFDEVMTGFRVGPAGAQSLYQVVPDLVCLGKVIGGGLPVGAYGGKREIMSLVAPLGGVYQAGTLSGNPLAMAAGIAQLKALQAPSTYETLSSKTKLLADGLAELSTKKIPMQVVSTCGMLTVFFTEQKVIDFATSQSCDKDTFAKIWRLLIEHGIYWPPSQFEAAFVSLVHAKEDILETVKTFEKCLAQL